MPVPAMVKEIIFSADVAASVQARAPPVLYVKAQFLHIVTVLADTSLLWC